MADGEERDEFIAERVSQAVAMEKEAIAAAGKRQFARCTKKYWEAESAFRSAASMAEARGHVDWAVSLRKMAERVTQGAIGSDGHRWALIDGNLVCVVCGVQSDWAASRKRCPRVGESPVICLTDDEKRTLDAKNESLGALSTSHDGDAVSCLKPSVLGGWWVTRDGMCHTKKSHW